MSALGLLGVCFIVMKIIGFIEWSWWLVTLPLWGGFAIAVVVIVVVPIIVNAIGKKR